MNKKRFQFITIALAMAGILFSTPGFAKPGNEHGHGGPHNNKRHHESPEHHGPDGNTTVNVDIHFGDSQRTAVRSYYTEEFHHGHCPPGLAKKGNGCMPPGQAKKWRRGYPLPRDVVYYDLPPQVVIEMGAPPAGYKYVRVAADILMIAVGTGIVVDAIEDLSNM